jgi:hypothetical protein
MEIKRLELTGGVKGDHITNNGARREVEGIVHSPLLLSEQVL